MRDGGLRQLERANLPKFHLASIETPFTGSGVPDMNYCCNGVEGWIENKATKGWAVKVRIEQVGWILRRCRAGGRVWVAVRRMAPAEDALYVVAGQHVAQLAQAGLKAVPWALHSPGGPARWDWPAFAGLLLG